MKEAAGEANMTVITIVLIGVVLAAGGLIVKGMMDSTKASSCCQSNGGVWRGGTCYATCSSSTGTTGCSGSVSKTCQTQ